MDPRFKAQRDLCPVFEQYAYLLTGETGPIPRYVYEDVKAYMDGRYYEGGDASWRGLSTFRMIPESRQAFAQMLGCDADDVAFGPNTSAMLAIFTDGLPLAPGDNIVTSSGSFSSMIYALDMLRREGIDIRHVAPDHGLLPTERLLAAVDENTRAVVLCHVEGNNGFRHDLVAIGAFCAERGIWFAVDAAHSAGVLPIDMEGMHIDFLCGNDYKWMMNFCGTGYACVRPALREVLRFRKAGWLSVKQLFVSGLMEAELSDTASRYELGYPCAPGIFGMGDVARRYLELGAKDIEAYVLGLTDYLYEQVQGNPHIRYISHYPEPHRSALAFLEVPGDAGVTGASLKQLGVQTTVHGASAPGEPTTLRVACHYVNNREDIDRLLAALDQLIGRR
ncbi:MAG: aminotransferase class V-fold PLP-dependent enzyme [Clostridiales bacterium]|nr:aminotransferase class V-fold PLP-dependent enzyme [Clostridiales bacterium]